MAGTHSLVGSNGTTAMASLVHDQLFVNVVVEKFSCTGNFARMVGVIPSKTSLSTHLLHQCRELVLANHLLAELWWIVTDRFSINGPVFGTNAR